jgi:hypothetical protein
MGSSEIKFRPFYIDGKVIKKYVEWFNKGEYKDILYEGTPRSKKDVKAWIISMIEDKSKRCYFVFKGGILLGNIELTRINFKTKTAQVHSFFASLRDWTGKPMRESLQFIIGEAGKLELSLLGADFGKEYEKLSKQFIKSGFIRDIQAPHYFTLRIKP